MEVSSNTCSKSTMVERMPEMRLLASRPSSEFTLEATHERSTCVWRRERGNGSEKVRGGEERGKRLCDGSREDGTRTAYEDSLYIVCYYVYNT